jgi:hypothetical protein
VGAIKIMRFLRKLVVFFSSLALVVILLLIASLVPVGKTLGNPIYIKNNLAASGIYDNFLSSIDFSENNQKNLPVNTPSSVDKDLESIVIKVFTPKTLQNTSETVIDGGFNWLRGKTPLPQFSIDLTGIKNSLTTEISAYLKNRVASLPACTSNPYQNFDIIDATCKPTGVVIADSVYTQTTNDAINEIEFLNKGQVTFDSFEVKDANSKDSIWQTAPKYYRWFNLAPVILGVIAFIGFGLTVLLCRNHWHGLKLVSHVFFTAGGALLATGLIVALFVSYGLKGSLALPASQAALSEDVLIPLLKKFINSIGWWTIDFGVFYLAAGFGCYSVFRHFSKRQVALPILAHDPAMPVKPADPKIIKN